MTTHRYTTRYVTNLSGVQTNTDGQTDRQIDSVVACSLVHRPIADVALPSRRVRATPRLTGMASPEPESWEFAMGRVQLIEWTGDDRLATRAGARRTAKLGLLPPASFCCQSTAIPTDVRWPLMRRCVNRSGGTAAADTYPLHDKHLH